MKVKKWSSLFLEMLMVMTGVFLALMADEWRENRQTAKSISIIEEKIIEEAHENYESLLHQKKRLNDRYSRLVKWGEGLDNTRNFQEQKDFPGFPHVYLASAAWKRANSSQIANLVDVDIITNANRLYAHNDAITRSQNLYLGLMYNKDIWDSELTMVNLKITKSLFKESISQVNQGLDYYHNFLELYPLSNREDE